MKAVAPNHGSSVIPLGTMRRLIELKDWSCTALGAREGWPLTLRLSVDAMLEQHLPTVILWGQDHIQIYNDSFAGIIGQKHPTALGAKAFDSWSELLPGLTEIYARAWGGEVILLENVPLTFDRYGFLEKTAFTVSYSPIRGLGGEVVGLLKVAIETTEQVSAERRKDDFLQQVEEGRNWAKRATEAGRIGLWEFDVLREEFRWDDQACSILGETDSVMKYESFISRLVEEDRAAFAATISGAISTQSTEAFALEFRFQSVTGIRWVSSRGKVSVEEVKGKLRKVVCGALVDETERRAMERQWEFLAMLSASVSHSNTPEEILDVATRDVAKYLSALRCSVFEPAGGGGLVTTQSWSAMKVKAIRGGDLKAELGHFSWWGTVQREPTR